MFAAMKPLMFARSLFTLGLGLGLADGTAIAAKGARSLTAFGHENCIELKNKTTRVVLAPSGGRVLAYEINGVNTLYLSESDSQGKTNCRRHCDGRSLLTKAFAKNRVTNGGKKGKG